MKKSAKKVSLVFALEEVSLVLDGLRILAEGVAHGGLGNAATMKKTPTVLAAGIAMLVSRINLLRRVVRGEGLAADLWSTFNDAGVEPHAGMIFPARRRKR